jgi:acetyl-CoA acetyltransferase
LAVDFFHIGVNIMADKRDVVVLSAVRSAIGSFGGALSSIEPSELGGMVMKEAVSRSGVDPQQINYVTVGNCIPTEARSAYVARIASIQAGLPGVRSHDGESVVQLGAAGHRIHRASHHAG